MGASNNGGAIQLRVLAETAYPASVASARVRLASFAPFLRPHAVALDFRPALSDADYAVLAAKGGIARKSAVLGRASARAVLSRRRPHDLLLVHRLRLLNPLPGFDPPRHLHVYDLDDALFVPFTTGVNRRFRWTKQEARRSVECMRRARLVLAGNPFLAGRARRYASRVEVVPSCVDPTVQSVHAHHEDREVTVGWLGSSTTTPYLRAVLPVFERLNAKRLRAKLVLVGADESISAPWVEQHRWSLAEERQLLASFDVGIIPQPDDEWARGKSGYKALQYFAAGIPAVGNAVGITRELIGRDRGLIAEDTDDWYRALESLIEDPALRREQGLAARRFVENHYSYQRWAPELAMLLRSLTD